MSKTRYNFTLSNECNSQINALAKRLAKKSGKRHNRSKAVEYAIAKESKSKQGQ